MKIIRIILASILIPLLIILFSFKLIVFDIDFYKSEFEKYEVYDQFDNKAEVDSALESLINYMKSGEPLSDFFNEKEKAHMVDVRNIIKKVSLIFYLLFIPFIGLFIWGRKESPKLLIYGGIVTLSLLLILFLVSHFGFDLIFQKFHEVSFDNDLWRLDPKVDYLKALMVDGFFLDALKRIFIISALISVFLIGLGVGGMFLMKKFFNEEKPAEKQEKPSEQKPDDKSQVNTQYAFEEKT